MDFHQLRYFLEVARQEHMGKAAQVLAISQSALSHAISALEEDLGVPLFERKGRGILLTPSGQLLLERGTRLLREKQILEEEMRSQSGELIGTIRLAAPVSINANFLGPAWANISAAHGRLRAEISSLRSIEIVEKAARYEIDYGLCFGPQAHPLIESSTLGRRKLLAVVHKGVGIGKKKTKEEVLQVLSDLPASLPRGLLGFGYGETHPFFKRYKIEPQVDLLYDHYEVALAYLSAKPAWALLPDWIVEKGSAFEALRSEDIFESLEITGVWAKNRTPSPLTKLVESEIKARLQGNPGRSKK
jgi:DNA-binding transcriptional LysR family regulator